MDKIKKVFQNKKKVKIGYLTCGFPDLKSTLSLVLALEEAGFDMIELGIPFSDPLADGPIIQRATDLSLKKGTKLKDIYKLVKNIRRKTDIPLIFLTYYNIVYNRGIKKFLGEAKQIGIDGLIIPDLIPEEASYYIKESEKHQLSNIFLISPLTSFERVRFIDNLTTDFLYYVSLTGVTGPREKLFKGLIQRLKDLKKIVKNHLCVGFGISKKWHIEQILKYADGVIIGSRILEFIDQNFKDKDFFKKFRKFLKDLICLS